jgi:hypothetical protein
MPFCPHCIAMAVIGFLGSLPLIGLFVAWIKNKRKEKSRG